MECSKYERFCRFSREFWPLLRFVLAFAPVSLHTSNGPRRAGFGPPPGPPRFFHSPNPVQAQDAAPEAEAAKPCSPSASHGKQPSDSEMSVVGVTFSGFLRMPVSDQDEIAASIKERTYADSIDHPEWATDEALETATVGWQNHGYLKARTNGYATTLSSNPAGRRVALSVHVDEGPQYRLGGIAFQHNRAIANVAALLGVFPIKEGDVFSKETVAVGLDNLRKIYGELGYASFRSVPETRFDEAKKLVYLDIDMVEGQQFIVNDINILGLNESARLQSLQDFLLKPGQIYNERLVELSLKRERGSVLPSCGCSDRPALDLDEKTGLVTLRFDFRSCGH